VDMSEELKDKPITTALGELYQELSQSNPFKYITFDTLDVLESEVAKVVCKEENVTDIADLSYGKGYSLVRERILSIIKSFQDLGSNIILVAHRKLTVAADTNIVKMNDISLTGKLKDFIFASCDAIAFTYREKEDDGTEYLKASFVPSSDDSVIAGSRIAKLNNKVVNLSKMENGELLFNWKQIYQE
jgi:hypothetical protein